jgi:heme exporter protein CcmD
MSGNGFFAMGGYAIYVWPSFALVIALLIGNALAARSLHRRARNEALRRFDAGQDRP